MKKPILITSYNTYDHILSSGNQIVYEIIRDYQTNKNILCQYIHENRVEFMELISKPPYGAFDRCVLEDSNGFFWICTYDEVVCLKNKQIIFHLDIKGANNIIQDHENNIWISSPNGAYRINPYFLPQNIMIIVTFTMKG